MRNVICQLKHTTNVLNEGLIDGQQNLLTIWKNFFLISIYTWFKIGGFLFLNKNLHYWKYVAAGKLYTLKVNLKNKTKINFKFRVR